MCLKFNKNKKDFFKKSENNFAIRKLISIFAVAKQRGAIAQLVEQWTENPCVPSSILGGTTKKSFGKTL